ncbi:cholesterol 7-desaturase nvd-like isoform X1 [Centruroides vittatus]|uniref:cholesterol 7-desaturase nvd-like isoform X1 n=2 Tax=Centruroides vittatus TaxID=120091 RepID=UPI00350FB81A
MSFFLSEIGSLTLQVAAWIFSFFECFFHYFVTFLVDLSGNPCQLIPLLLILVIIYYSLVNYDKTVDMTETGYDYLRPKARKLRQNLSLLVREVKETRDSSELPPVYPNGWIPLMESRDLAIGQSVPVTALGHQFAIFRGKTGKSFVLDAFCPHLGAHLGVKSKVYGDCVQCPFHGWLFSGKDGSCQKIPYTDKVPKFAKVKTWTSLEQNGFIYVWHHAEGHPPYWKPPIIPEIEQGLWSYKGRTQYTTNCHTQELPENGADIMHLDSIHQASIFSGSNFHPDNWWNFCKHIWSSSWNEDPEPNQHMTTMKITNYIKIFGISLPWFSASLDIKQIGPAIVHLYITSIFGRGIFIQSITPERPLQQKIVHHYYGPRFSQISASILLLLEAKMVERDVLVWNNKKFLKAPLLVKEDKFILRFRRWYSQFYSENSPRLSKKILTW